MGKKSLVTRGASLSIHLSISIYLSLFVSVYLYLSISIYLSIYISIYIYKYIYICRPSGRRRWAAPGLTTVFAPETSGVPSRVAPPLGLRVWGSGFRVQGRGFGV